ncbi:MAG: CARDB domain-containing protein [Parcubacteria group bacterium]
MVNTFLSKNKILPAAILLGGALVALAVLISANFASAQSSNAPQVLQWTEPAGLGISAPACSSASPTTTCVNNTPQATLSWTYGGQHGTCLQSTVTVTGVESVVRECDGTRTLNNLSNNTTYSYSVVWDTYVNDGDGFLYLQDVVSGSFTTPNCAVATNYTLGVNSSGASSVSITGSPSTYSGTTNYTKTVADGTSLSLTASTTSGSANFSSWSGCNSTSGTGNRTCNVTMSANKTVTVNYTTTTTLNVESRTASNVSISRVSGPSDVAGITNYTRTYSGGISAVLRAPATSGTTIFSSWLAGGCDSIGGSGNRDCTVSVNNGGTKTVTVDYDFSGPPATPTLDSVTTSCNASDNPRNTLTWSVSDSTGITHYHIERCTGSGCTNFTQIDTKNVSPYNDTSVTSGTLYRYRIRAHNHDTSLYSGYSNIVARTTTNCPIDLPDLTAGASSPGTATVGLPVTLSASVSNIGTASTGAGFTNLFQRATSASGAGATDIGTHVRGSALGTGNSINATLSYTFPSAGNYYIRVCADKSAATNNGVITELNENNNCGDWSSITVASFNYNLSNSGTSSVTKGSGNVFTQNTITKTLTASPTQSVTLSLAGVPSGTTYSISNSSCSPTCTSVITFTVSPSTLVGTYPITVTGSPLNKQTNFNLVISGSPMSVSCSADKGTALVGETVTWTATVSGGTLPLSYSWSGTSIPTNPAPSTNPFSIVYSTIGLKNTTVTVTDDVSLQATCLSTIQINFDPEFEEF